MGSHSMFGLSTIATARPAYPTYPAKKNPPEYNAQSTGLQIIAPSQLPQNPITLHHHRTIPPDPYHCTSSIFAPQHVTSRSKAKNHAFRHHPKHPPQQIHHTTPRARYPLVRALDGPHRRPHDLVPGLQTEAHARAVFPHRPLLAAAEMAPPGRLPGPHQQMAIPQNLLPHPVAMDHHRPGFHHSLPAQPRVHGYSPPEYSLLDGRR